MKVRKRAFDGSLLDTIITIVLFPFLLIFGTLALPFIYLVKFLKGVFTWGQY